MTTEQSRRECVVCGEVYMQSKMYGDICFDCYENGDELEGDASHGHVKK